MAFAREIIKMILSLFIYFRQSEIEKDSYYTEINDVLVRISNHCTWMYVWDNYLEQNPKQKGKSIVSIVFEDSANTYDESCLLLKRFRMNPIKINEYVYPIHGNGKLLKRQDIKKIVYSLKTIHNGEFLDPTGKCVHYKRISENPPTSDNKNISESIKTIYTKTKNNRIKITERELKQIVSESIKRVLEGIL